MLSIKQVFPQNGNWQAPSLRQLLAVPGLRMLGLGCLLLCLSIPGVWGNTNPFWWLAWVALVPLLWALNRCSRPMAAWLQGLAFGTLYHMVYFSWFMDLYPLGWLGLPNWAGFLIAVVTWLLLALIQGLIISVIWWLAYLVRRPTCRWAWLPILPVLWVGLLWGLNQSAIGVPWGWLSHSQADVDGVRHSVYALGMLGLEAVMVGFNVAVYLLVESLAKKHSGGNRVPLWQMGFPAITAVCLAIMVGWAPVIAHPRHSGRVVLASLNPVVFQGDLTMDDDHYDEVIRTGRLGLASARQKWARYEVAARPLLNEGRQSLFVWPEGILTPATKYQAKQWLASWVSQSAHVALFSGALTLDDWNRPFNSAILIQADQQTLAIHKRHLVAFGETVPFVPAEWFSWLVNQLFGLPYQPMFNAGALNQPGISYRGHRIGAFICFEAIYPSLSHIYRHNGVDVLVTVSNLGWFHHNRMLGRQFLGINRIRATEAGLPLILAVNSGPSAYIDGTGKIIKQSPPAVAAVLPYDNSLLP
ncbi:MAG: apolipoprotein N-acyltransferase [Cyanobacteria bacterium HKST-UBA04]|nr:apolipoprotein N-acyltransferase [Cyanobacteria bacterium HKST-UBA04]